MTQEPGCGPERCTSLGLPSTCPRLLKDVLMWFTGTEEDALGHYSWGKANENPRDCTPTSSAKEDGKEQVLAGML